MNPDTAHFTLVGTRPIVYPAQTTDSIFDSIQEKVPVWNSFTSLADADAVNGLSIRANATEKVFRNCIPVPPLLAAPLIHQGGTSIQDLIMTAMTTIKAFDEEHKDTADIPSANTNYQMIVNWFYLAMKKKLATMAATPSINIAIITASNKIHDEFILPTKTTENEGPITKTSDTLSQLALYVGEQTTVLQSLNKIAEESA